MAYSNFTDVEAIANELNLSVISRKHLFSDIPAIDYSQLLTQILEDNVPLALAINTEKSRSELIITPILVELRKKMQDKISLFSGREFNVAPEKGLNGFCDFLISRSPEQLFIQAPAIAIVEAKNDNIQGGLAQCIAEMVAAQLFNEQKQNAIARIYGVVTTGTNWRFLQLEDRVVQVDLTEYFLDNLGQIIGIFCACIDDREDGSVESPDL
ncbi:hypothetical protein [Roseofilum casamattae]|uniref:Uncharacterized protein n=1 Tax=Roseofilum casamattae BLCC-M143 TaxID=3022442 RepID=A0ABT7C191_9CYAN|nr:hypothetical protein [Roseofilum casamattae]MDJ1185216.1 hypothetical protein [Roseofilum casamattae BLCC-M143]